MILGPGYQGDFTGEGKPSPIQPNEVDAPLIFGERADRGIRGGPKVSVTISV